MVDWQFTFLNKDTHEQVSIFNEILINIFSNYIPHNYVTIDDRDPPWMTEKIKNKINLKKSLYKSNKFIELQKLSTEISTLISNRKEKYYHNLSLKLNDPKTSAKTYWSILKCFYNNSKIPLLPPLKVDFFATQCTPLPNSSVLPSAINSKTHARLSSIDFDEEDILKIIRKLDNDKAHGHDNISIRMLKIYDSVLVEPLSQIYKNCINSGVFPDIWKKSHIIPTYKKNDKCCINNYCPVSLLPICGKIFERILYNPLFLYLESNNLLTPHQSGFRPNDSCIYQLLSIVHIYLDFDHNPSLEVRGNFLDISKAFDKV